MDGIFIKVLNRLSFWHFTFVHTYLYLQLFYIQYENEDRIRNFDKTKPLFYQGPMLTIDQCYGTVVFSIHKINHLITYRFHTHIVLKLICQAAALVIATSDNYVITWNLKFSERNSALWSLFGADFDRII